VGKGLAGGVAGEKGVFGWWVATGQRVVHRAQGLATGHKGWPQGKGPSTGQRAGHGPQGLATGQRAENLAATVKS